MKTLAFLLSFFIFINVNAQWTPDTSLNTLVADSQCGDMKAIGTSDGQTYVVFWKVVPAPVNYELRLQLLDVSGYKQFGPDGMLISNNLSMSTWTAIMSITVDNNDNLYIGLTGTTTGAGFAFKMDINGNHLWGANGVTFNDGWQVIILPLSSGDAIVSWNATGPALMQKYDASGNAIWAAPQPVVSGSSSTAPGNLFELSDGDYIMVFHVVGFGISSTLYAHRYNGNGAPQWTLPTQLSNKGTVFNTSYSGTQDGDNIYYGYKGSTGMRFDSFVVRLNPDGTLPWGINGMDFDINQTDYEMDTKIAFSIGSQYVWAICTYMNTGQSESGEYVQKFDKVTGARQFTNNAKMVYAISNGHKQHASSLFLINDQPFFMLKTGFDNGVTPTTLRSLMLNANGDFAWTEETRPLATYPANKQRTHLTQPVNGQAVAVFIEDKSSGSKIYAQNFTDDVIAGFIAVPSVICVGDTINFYDNSTGNVITWNWNFTWGTPQSSVIQNPTVAYYTPGTYDVELIVSDGTNVDTMTMHNYIEVYDYPVADAGPDVTICPGANTTLTASGGAAFVWSTNPPQTTASITVSPGTQTTYYVTVSNNICSDVDSVTVFIASVVHLGADTTLSQGASFILDAGPNFINYLWSDASTGQYMIVNAAGTYWVQVAYPGGCISSDTIVVSIGYRLEGTIAYKNASNTAINNTKLLLTDAGGTIDSLITDINGYYLFDYMANGDYYTVPHCTKAWGGGNSTDALAVMKHFVGLIYLYGLNADAADVNATGYANSADALMVQQRYLGMISSFSAGDWVFENNLIPLYGVSIVNDFYGLCYGDVNGSYTPPSTKQTPTVSLNIKNTIEIDNNEIINVPLITETPISVAAISLELFYPQELIIIEDVSLAKNSNEKLLFYFKNGILRISWYSLESVDFNTNDILLNISLRIKKDVEITGDYCNFTLSPYCELSDIAVHVIDNVKLNMPALSIMNTPLNNYLGYNHPNPFLSITQIEYGISEPGFIRLRIFNILGEEAALLVNERQDKGNYQVNFDASGLKPGNYFYTIEVSRNANSFTKTRIMQLE
ncbi:MAG: PKD domain-containing protein [Bacteroidales bacterium]|nr:PKD domain-containing protein [Bacteroidales bacterium]